MSNWKAEFEEVELDRNRWRELAKLRTEERDKWMSTAEANAHSLEEVIRNLQERLAEAVAERDAFREKVARWEAYDTVVELIDERDKYKAIAERFYNTDPRDPAAMQFAYMAYEEACDGSTN